MSIHFANLKKVWGKKKLSCQNPNYPPLLSPCPLLHHSPVESCEVPPVEDEPSIYDDINHEDPAGITGNDNEEDIDEAMFQIVSQEEVLRSINEYTHPKLPAAVPQKYVHVASYVTFYLSFLLLN